MINTKVKDVINSLDNKFEASFEIVLYGGVGEYEKTKLISNTYQSVIALIGECDVKMEDVRLNKNTVYMLAGIK